MQSSTLNGLLDLPLEILELIALQHHDICLNFCITCKLLKLLSQQTMLKRYFSKLFSHEHADEWRLPNGWIHREDDLPAVICKKSFNPHIGLHSNITIIVKPGTMIWYRDGCVHRDNDRPAIIYPNGDMIWCRNGLIHRENDMPAIKFPDTEENSYRRLEWWYNDVRHRENDTPAVIIENNVQYWYRGKLHRENDKPASLVDGMIGWYYDGKRHRENDMPAVIYPNGTMEWWYNDHRHRDGYKPAIIYSNGTEEYWYYGYRKNFFTFYNNSTEHLYHSA